MKYTVVPAQVTTVEDKIAGSLSMSQLMLLITPVFFGSALYVLLPPNLHFAPYKILAMLVLLIVCGLSAIRIKGKILLLWAITVARYNLRPRYYLFNKNSLATREEYTARYVLEAAQTVTTEQLAPQLLPDLTVLDKFRIETLLANPAANVAYELTKGGLYVRITEVKEAS